jgi:hypothetical protein
VREHLPKTNVESNVKANGFKGSGERWDVQSVVGNMLIVLYAALKVGSGH